MTISAQKTGVSYQLHIQSPMIAVFYLTGNLTHSIIPRMGYTMVCTPILYPILYWTKTAEQYQYPITILY